VADLWTPGGDEHPTLVIYNADTLREHLDTLNESGVHPIAVGIDALHQPFLIALVGSYAEGETVLFDSPWQSDVDWSTGSSQCDECAGHAHGIDDLHYPVEIMRSVQPVLP
jgi:hypothetical protein